MPSFGRQSRERRDTCEISIQDVLNEAIKEIDFSVVCGHRTEPAQTEAFDAGNSQVRWPFSNHNILPSQAVDIIPYPMGYESIPHFYELASYMYAAAAKLGVHLKWGGHWKNFTGKGDQDRDWAHWELAND